jgi:FKBP-type peptidyl-prolyl cis-trans isomerase
MQKFFTPTLNLFVAGMMVLGAGLSQAQTSSTTTAPAKTSTATRKPATTKAHTATSSSSAVTLKTKKDKLSYALGMNIGTNLQKQQIPLDSSLLARGIKDSMTGAKTLLTADEMKTVLTEAQNEMKQEMEAKMKSEADTNKKAGEDFLAANKAKQGVMTLPSGLEYKVITQGSGAKPTTSDTVVCNYRGTLLNGTEFDSSYKRGQPATLPVSGVIKGWTEALQLMKAGSKYQLVIPADLAYGERGAGSDIGPNATLLFEVELVGIVPAGTTPTPKPAVYDSSRPAGQPGAANPPKPAASAKPSPTSKM